jgi:hypothetical protein
MKLQEQEIKEVYHNWREAVIVHDIPFLEHLFSNNFKSLRTVGRPKNKTDELQWLAVRNVQYLYWKDKNIEINASDDVALITCNQTLDVLVYELPAKIEREIMLTFIRQDNQWQLLQFQEIPVRFTKTK